ncbi:hypothetical protein MVEN_01430600 [Mycena venus]|uniref:Uncharacterized protein n=1 Tax=Mycena venus TaxID=2733690 RepID=A0A8H6XZ73_9AGAR|nr:hypothetical protein MVEN_01430600 [Mycena venus]
MRATRLFAHLWQRRRSVPTSRLSLTRKSPTHLRLRAVDGGYALVHLLPPVLPHIAGSPPLRRPFLRHADAGPTPHCRRSPRYCGACATPLINADIRLPWEGMLHTNFRPSFDKQNDSRRVTDRSRPGPVKTTAVHVDRTAYGPVRLTQALFLKTHDRTTRAGRRRRRTRTHSAPPQALKIQMRMTPFTLDGDPLGLPRSAFVPLERAEAKAKPPPRRKRFQLALEQRYIRRGDNGSDA